MRSTEPNRYSATRLGELGLAGAGGAGEQEHADRLAGIVEAGLEHGDALDDGRDGLVLADDAAREVVPDRAEIDALLVVEDRHRQPRELGQRDDDLVRLDPFRAGLQRAVDRQLDEVEHGAREMRRAQVLPCRAERDGHAVRIDLQVGLVRQPPDPRLRQLRRLLRRLRLDAHGLQEAAQRGSQLQQARRARRRRLGPHDQPAGDDRGEDLVEHARRLSLMGAAARHQQDVRDVPDQLLGRGQLLDRALDAAFELAEPLLAGHQVGGAGLEHAPAFALEPLREEPQERRLAHAVLAADQQRSRGRLQRRGLGSHQGLPPQLGLDQQLRLLPVGPEAAEGGEKCAIDTGALDVVELPYQCRRMRVVDALEERPDLRRRGGVGGAERGTKYRCVFQPLPLGEVVAEQPRHDQVVAPPILGTGHRISRRRPRLDGDEIGEREVDRPGVELLELRHDLAAALAAVGAAPQRGESGARQRPVGAECILHHRVEGHGRVFQQLHGLRELRLILQLPRVCEVGGERREHGLQAMQARGQRGDRDCRSGISRHLGGCCDSVGFGQGLRLRRPRPRELPSGPRREPQPDGQTDYNREKMLQDLKTLGGSRLRVRRETVRIPRRGVNGARREVCSAPAIAHQPSGEPVEPRQGGCAAVLRRAQRLSWPSSVLALLELPSLLTKRMARHPPCAGLGRPCGARATELRLREDGYEASTSVAFQGRRWRRMALRMVRSLRATAMAATIFGLPAAIKRRRKALRTGL